MTEAMKIAFPQTLSVYPRPMIRIVNRIVFGRGCNKKRQFIAKLMDPVPVFVVFLSHI
jgi:hypothetical protein